MTIATAGTATEAHSASANNLVISVPSGTVAGDVLVFSATHQNQPSADWTLPAAFTRTGSAFIVNDADQRGTIIAYHVVTATAEPASYTFNFPGTGRITGELRILRGVDTTNPIDGFPASKSTASGNTRTMPAFTIGHDNAYLHLVANNQTVSPNPATVSIDSSMTELVLLSSNGSTDNTAITRTLLGVFGKALGAAGTSPTPTVTWPAATGASIMAVAFRAAVVATNNPPTASFTHSESSLTTTLNGSGSSDSDGTIASYDWDFGDGTTHGTTASLTHTYSAPGTYNITLTVTDDKGATGTQTQSITVSYPTTTLSRVVGSAKSTNLVWKISGGAKAPLAKVYQVGTGVQTVSAMLAKSGFVVGHMGARWDEVEGSMEGFTRALMWDADALMISLARTSDGQFFILNDTKYLDRMTLGNSAGTTLDSSTMTWAQVQAYDQGSYWTKRATSTPRRPYMLLTDFLAAYPTAGPIFLDPKTISSTYFSAILDIMDANGGPSRFIGKSYCTGTGWAQAVHARNASYKTWGYFYASEIAAGTVNLDTLEPYWDLLGLDHAGASAQWTQVLAKGKPVIGHIAKTRANYDTAISKGASGVMCEGVAEVRLFA